MPAESQLRRLEEMILDKAQPDRAAAALGTVVAVTGAQAVVRFSADACAAQDGGIGGCDATVGMYVGIPNGRALVIAAVNEMSLAETGDGARAAQPSGCVDLLGEIVADAAGAQHFRRGITGYPRIGGPVVAVGERELRMVFDIGSASTIEIGHLQQDRSIGAYINVDEMVQKHFAVFGSTGSGKSTSVAVILREILQSQPGLRMLLIDPHNEYAGSFGDHAYIVRPGNLQLPYWLLSFDEIVEVIFGRGSDARDEIALLAELITQAKNDHARRYLGERTTYRQLDVEGGKYTADTPVPYRMEDLVTLADSRMGKLENRDVAARYHRLIARLNAARKNPRYAFIFDDAHVDGDSMIDILCDLLRLESADRAMTIVQLAGFPAETFDAIVSALFRMAFEFGLWSDGALPLLVICEEAHNYANADPSIGFRPARQALARIAKEGRKYGVFLGLITQRPAQIDPTLVSQCSTVFAMRMADERDQKIVRSAVSDPGNRLLGFLPSLATREALAFGAGVPMATRLRFKELPEDCIPRSEAVWGKRVDPGARIGRGLVASVVDRWRGVAANTKLTQSAPRLNGTSLPG